MSVSSTHASAVTLADLLAEGLYAAGVRRAYGVPGGGNLELVEALEDVGITWVLSHTETGAAFMACADAEINRVPGVLVVGNGPGLASAVNGVAHAWLDRVPLVIISDRHTDAEAALTGHQVLDQRAILAPIVKLSATLTSTEASGLIKQAISDALDPPAGPVHFDMSRDSAGAPVRQSSTPRSHSEPRRASIEGLLLERFAQRLASAARPVLLIGLGANADLERERLCELSHAAGAAVMTTYKAKGTYPESDGRWAGILTGAEIERPLLERADLILAVGLDAVELLGRPWPYRAAVLSLTTASESDAYLRPEERLVGDIAAAVDAIATQLDLVRGNVGFAETEIEEVRNAALDSLRLDAEEPLPGWRIVETVTQQLPDAVTVAVDAGAHMFPATNFVRPSGPRRFLISNGLATMGFAVPAAIGAALARPDELAVAFTGDGGMAYHVSELETAVRIGARIIVVVFNDSSLSLIRIKQEAQDDTRQRLNFGLTEFNRLARGLGVKGVRVDTEAELSVAVRNAVERPGSTVIDVRTTGREYARMLRAIRG
jgi:acetolactate synthase-1/2/3 large subunit